jgi:hypothetical protein
MKQGRLKLSFSLGLLFLLLSAAVILPWKANAETFGMQTGYYVGTGSTLAISGLGFQPQFVIIKSSTAAGQGAFKLSSMPASNIGYFSATANNTSSLITFDGDGFSVGNSADVNSTNVIYQWVAFAGSDCTASGTICVGTYNGNGGASQAVSTGFSPAFVMVKRSTNVAASFRTTSMASNMGQYFTTTAQVINGTLFQTLDPSGFTVGSVNNVSGGSYYYVAFKAIGGVMAVGSYSGSGVDNRNITGFGTGYTPNVVLVKNATSSTTSNRGPWFVVTQTFGDHASRLEVATANAANIIQILQDDGFQVGSSNYSNQSGATIYWVAFGGASAPSASGTFTMDTGSYVGTGSGLAVTGVSFSPDLVVIKDNAANHAVFRTKLMKGDTTAYLSNASANFASGIASLNDDGFSVGTNAAVNTNGNVYHWQAFGNAYNPETNSGAIDFAIGSYLGNAVDNRNITNIPFQPDLVAVKANAAYSGVWRTSALSGDLSSSFAASAEAANIIQALNPDGFQVGATAGVINTSASQYFWFAFKKGDNFTVNTYTGSGSSKNISTVGFAPNLVWVKRSTAVNGVTRPATLCDDASQYFANVANISDRIKGFLSDGFVVGGSQTETNTNGGTYRYAAWRIPVGDAVVSVTISSDGTVEYGALSSGGTVDTVLLGDTQIAINNGEAVENLNIKTSDATGGTAWVVGSAPGNNVFAHEFSADGGSNWTHFTAADVYTQMATGVLVCGTQNFDLKITVPAVSSDAQQKSISVTIQAVAP